MGKYIPVQMNRGVTGNVLIEIGDKTVPGLILSEIVYNVKKKLGCIFVENHTDILTFSREPWAHFRHLSQVARAKAATGIKIQPCKTKLFQSEVEYLGHKISKGRVSMIPEYGQKIKDWTVLKSGKEVAMFLGFAGYYCTFIPQYSALTNRLNRIKKALVEQGDRTRFC